MPLYHKTKKEKCIFTTRFFTKMIFCISDSFYHILRKKTRSIKKKVEKCSKTGKAEMYT